MLAFSRSSCQYKSFIIHSIRGLCRHYSSLTQTVQHASQLPEPRLDYRAISDNVEYKTRNALIRKAPIPADTVQNVAQAYKEHSRLSSVLNAKRNARSLIGEEIQKSGRGGDANTKAALLQNAKDLKEEIHRLEQELDAFHERLLRLALSIPNDTHSDTPVGPESSVKPLSIHGPTPVPASLDRDHVQVSKQLELVDLDAGSTVTGSSWYYLLNEAALLEHALTGYALSVAMERGFTPVTTPDVIRSDIASRCGFQPRDHADVAQAYHIQPTHPSPELILSGTAEIPLAGMFANRIFPYSALPRKVVGVGHAFRAEAGARGADTRGLYRVHQFTKVELFAVTASDKSEEMMEEMKSIQIRICEGLGFPFRVLDMPSEELGASAYRKYDIEAWMPGRGSWGEISSLSNCTDYQTRRLHIRYRLPPSPSDTSTSPCPPTFAHTLNGTAAAIPRLVIALIENGVQLDDKGHATSINLPSVLRPFWIGRSKRDIIRWV